MFSLNCRGKAVFIEKPLVMGILNLTADSFYASSRAQTVETIIARVGPMLEAGADIIDLGAQSTRPGSTRMSAEQELERLIPVIEVLCENFPGILISVDTYHSRVAAESVSAGASIINDISGGQMDEGMIPAVGKLHVPYICTHLRGVPETMHHSSQYDDLITEMLDYFIARIHACETAGILDVIVDPGFGFGKNISQNLKILKELQTFQVLGKPVMAGISRKSTIYKTLKTGPEQALNGTTVLNTLALMNGASLLRVHDVREARETITLVEAYRSS